MNTNFARETACSWCLRSLVELLHMLADEADTEKNRFASCTLGNWVLTILTAGLPYEGDSRDNDANKFQGNYDYDAHAQVYTGGADPLGSQGYASVVKNPSSS